MGRSKATRPAKARGSSQHPTWLHFGPLILLPLTDMPYSGPLLDLHAALPAGSHSKSDLGGSPAGSAGQSGHILPIRSSESPPLCSIRDLTAWLPARHDRPPSPTLHSMLRRISLIAEDSFKTPACWGMTLDPWPPPISHLTSQPCQALSTRQVIHLKRLWRPL